MTEIGSSFRIDGNDYVVKPTKDPQKVPPEHRRLVLCVESPREQGIDWLRIARKSLGLTTPLLLALDILDSILSEEDLTKNALAVTVSDAATKLKFLPGHPQVNELYLQHPLASKPDRYFLVGSYLKDLYEEKVTSFIGVLGELAVRRITAKYVHGVTSFAGAEASASAEGAEGKASGNLGSEGNSEFHLVAEYEPKHEPRQPTQDRFPWFAWEPTWRQIAESRLEHGLKEITAKFVYDAKSFLGLELSELVDKIGGKLKMDTRFSEKTEWLVHIQF
jgi:hypothetical protein